MKYARLAVITLVVAGVAGVVIARHTGDSQDLKAAVAQGEPAAATAGFAVFDPNGFKAFHDTLAPEHATRLEESPWITDDRRADQRIVAIAEARGYRLRSVALTHLLVEVDGQRLQSEAKLAWEELKADALEHGIELTLISGYRSVERQRAIFRALLREEAIKELGRSFTKAEIAQGKADNAIDRILAESSIPGYSKHHSGYTLDIGDATSGLDFTEFRQTQGFSWLSQNNYLNAKRHGFIPSYPEGAEQQGPDPEAWEYVWVGVESLMKGQTNGNLRS